MTLYSLRNEFHLSTVYVAKYLDIPNFEYKDIECGFKPISDEQYTLLKKLFGTDFTIDPDLYELFPEFLHDEIEIEKLKKFQKPLDKTPLL